MEPIRNPNPELERISVTKFKFSIFCVEVMFKKNS